MEGCLSKTVRSFKHSSDAEIVRILRADRLHEYKVTKSLFNILYNVCVVGSVWLSRPLKQSYRAFTNQVLEILNDTWNIGKIQRIFAQNPALCRILAKSCPRVASTRQ